MLILCKCLRQLIKYHMENSYEKSKQFNFKKISQIIYHLFEYVKNMFPAFMLGTFWFLIFFDALDLFVVYNKEKNISILQATLWEAKEVHHKGSTRAFPPSPLFLNEKNLLSFFSLLGNLTGMVFSLSRRKYLADMGISCYGRPVNAWRKYYTFGDKFCIET